MVEKPTDIVPATKITKNLKPYLIGLGILVSFVIVVKIIKDK